VQRFGRRRGVSPIIATILLVAVTVVLAAVLYMLVGGLLTGPRSTPLGAALALGPATVFAGSASTAAYCATGHTCYSVSIASTGDALSVGEVGFVLQNGTGANQVAQNGSGRISFVTATGVLIAQSSPIAAGRPLGTTSWTYGSGSASSTPVSSAFQVWVQFGNTIPNPSAYRFVLEAIGMGPFSGTITYALP
jgi:flagellin-like protein